MTAILYQWYGEDHHIVPRTEPELVVDETPPEPDSAALNEAHASGLLSFEGE